MKWVFRHVRCILGMSFALIWWSGIPAALFGVVNKRLRLVRSVFYCYAGNSRYAHHYCYSWAYQFYKWRPSPIGVFRQGGSWGLICASPVSEREFHDLNNRRDFLGLISRVSRIRQLVGADYVSFAGVLPSYLKREQLEPPDASPVDGTAEVVTAAIQQIQNQHFSGLHHEVVLIGGSGRVGRQVHSRLVDSGVSPKVLDPAATTASYRLTDFHGRPTLIVDMSRRGVLEICVDDFPGDAVLLNEVFPEPPAATRQRLRARGVTVYHLAGVAANVYPSLPLGYRNAVPCCAMHAGGEFVPVLSKLA